MLKNAHIWSKGAALIRALGLLAGVQRFVGWRAMGKSEPMSKPIKRAMVRTAHSTAL